jgi:hypothetical protein
MKPGTTFYAVGEPAEALVQGSALRIGAKFLDECLRTDQGPIEVRADTVLDLMGMVSLISKAASSRSWSFSGLPTTGVTV